MEVAKYANTEDVGGEGEANEISAQYVKKRGRGNAVSQDIFTQEKHECIWTLWLACSGAPHETVFPSI